MIIMNKENKDKIVLSQATFRQKPESLAGKKSALLVILALYSLFTVLILALTPAEKSLGSFIKYVFFHLSLSWSALYGFFLAAILGLVYIIAKGVHRDKQIEKLTELVDQNQTSFKEKENKLINPEISGLYQKLGSFSKDLSRVSLVVWFFSVIVSIFAMKMAWGVIHFREPATIFVLLVLAIGIGKELIIADLDLTKSSWANAIFALAIFLARPFIAKDMHPVDPIGESPMTIFKTMSSLLTLVSFLALLAFSYYYYSYKNKTRTKVQS